MGSWGAGAFENDDAADWLGGLCDAPSTLAIHDVLSIVGESQLSDYLEAPDCAIALAAAEVIAALKGAPHSDLPAKAKECLAVQALQVDSALISLARRAVERIRSDSELKSLWDESESPEEWYDEIDDLLGRLRQ